MKSLIFAIALSVFGLTALAQDRQSVDKLIASNEADLGRAMIGKDTNTLSRLVGDEWTIQSESGTSGTKAGFIHDIESGKLIVRRFDLHDLHVKVIGDVAWVFGTDDEISSYDGKPSNGRYNWLDVWVRRDGHWVSVATQITRVKAAG